MIDGFEELVAERRVELQCPMGVGVGVGEANRACAVATLQKRRRAAKSTGVP